MKTMPKEKIIPTGEKVLLVPVKVEEKTASGIYRPDAGEQKSQLGEVRAVGHDADAEMKKGDRVLYKKFAGDEVEYGNIEYIIIKQEDILAIVE